MSVQIPGANFDLFLRLLAFDYGGVKTFCTNRNQMRGLNDAVYTKTKQQTKQNKTQVFLKPKINLILLFKLLYTFAPKVESFNAYLS